MVKQWKRSLSGDDVQAEAEDALEKDISQMSPASNSVAANLDGGVAAVDWSSKTIKVGLIFNNFAGVALDVSGSGYLLGCQLNASIDTDSITLRIDGTSLIQDKPVSNIGFIKTGASGKPWAGDLPFNLARFDSGFELEVTDTSENISGVIFYALD